jgi:hypothetical protein
MNKTANQVRDQVRDQVWDQVQHQIQQDMIRIQYQVFNQLTMVALGNARNSFSNL